MASNKVHINPFPAERKGGIIKYGTVFPDYPVFEDRKPTKNFGFPVAKSVGTILLSLSRRQTALGIAFACAGAVPNGGGSS